MCGVVGIFAPPGHQREDLSGRCRVMADTLAHRGPDDQGLFCDEASGIALGHRRLSILDLSPLGRQPMRSATGRYTLCYNGEVFNHLELRRELETLGHGFRGGSDTETMLAAIEQWGLVPAVERFVGMFAFALWDAAEQALHLVRDRLGVKPLHYGRAGSAWVFGSELKALRAHPDFAPVIDQDALALYFRHGYIPAPHSIYRGVRKLLPGTILTLRAPEAEPQTQTYWAVDEVWRRGAATPFPGGEDEAADELERLLRQSVRLRLLSDVPLGALLSGGVDSSLVAALMRAEGTGPVRSFAIGFAEAAFDESPHARAVARHLGCEHTELRLTPGDLLDMVPGLPRVWDEPFADPSQIPTQLVYRLARRHVTVALSGDGGDELFGGYSRYFVHAPARLRTLPGPLRPAAAALARLLPEATPPLLGGLPWKLRWRLDALAFNDFSDHYRHFTSLLRHPEDLVPGGREPAPRMTAQAARGLDRHQAMSCWDLMQYLPDDILTKVDRASMAASLEARTPLLDHRLVEFAATLPTAWKVRGGQGKHILRRVLHRHVPPELVERPKMGFGVPIGQWLRGPLRAWAQELLEPARIARGGVLDARFVARIWREHLAGRADWNYTLWSVLMFEAWRGEAGL